MNAWGERGADMLSHFAEYSFKLHGQCTGPGYAWACWRTGDLTFRLRVSE